MSGVYDGRSHENCPEDNFEMEIKWVPASNKLTVKLNDNERYAEEDFTQDKIFNGSDHDGHFYRQSYWGTGTSGRSTENSLCNIWCNPFL